MSSLDRFDWLSKVREEPVDPQRRILDSHHHLWDRGGSKYLMEEFAADTSLTHNVIGTVFVECMASYRVEGPEKFRPVGEVEFVAVEAARSNELDASPILGIVGFADLCLGETVVDVLGELESVGSGLFRGIRYSTAWDASAEIRPGHTNPTPQIMEDQTFRTGLMALGSMGYTFDAWLYHPQLNDFASLANSCPEVTMILNHLGGPLGIGPYAGKHDEVVEQWQSSMRLVAKQPNVFIKIGGLGLDWYFGTGWTKRAIPPTSDELARYWAPMVHWCIDTFGPSRCMFESNFPVDRQSSSYGTLWNAFQKLADRYDNDEQDALFCNTAIQVYDLDF